MQINIEKMKTLKISNESEKNIKNATPEKTSAFRILKSVLIIFILAMTIGLSSCAMEMRTPHPYRTGIIISGENGGEYHNQRERHHRSEHRDRRNNDHGEGHDR